MMQEYDGVKHPVMYASKKMLPREQTYSVGQREALAIVWAVNKFHRYLYGQHFILESTIGVFTDIAIQESQDNEMEFVFTTLSLHSQIRKR